jgi:hypothetical protein
MLSNSYCAFGEGTGTAPDAGGLPVTPAFAAWIFCHS